jgi:hypothetical protein
MLFVVGTKVKFLHTGDEGVVTGLLEGGMVNVYIRSADMEIPAFADDLIRAEAFEQHPVKAKFVEGKKEPTAQKPPPISIETQYTILKSYGIQLAFLQQTGAEGLPEKYQIFLINDTNYDVTYRVRFQTNHRKQVLWSDKLKKASAVMTGEMAYDDLNEAPEFEIECFWLTTEGAIGPVFKTLKIKPKTFFSNLRTAPLLNKPAHLFRLFERLPSSSGEKNEEDLSDYTKRHAKPSWRFSQSEFRIHAVADSKELAEFEPEIDLHIENLSEKSHKMSAADILRLQLSVFENYLAKAIRLGVPRVFVIHGIGEGRLKDEIATRLMKNPDVQTFKNEYHHRYGWGATEIVF